MLRNTKKRAMYGTQSFAYTTRPRYWTNYTNLCFTPEKTFFNKAVQSDVCWYLRMQINQNISVIACTCCRISCNFVWGSCFVWGIVLSEFRWCGRRAIGIIYTWVGSATIVLCLCWGVCYRSRFCYHFSCCFQIAADFSVGWQGRDEAARVAFPCPGFSAIYWWNKTTDWKEITIKMVTTCCGLPRPAEKNSSRRGFLPNRQSSLCICFCIWGACSIHYMPRERLWSRCYASKYLDEEK